MPPKRRHARANHSSAHHQTAAAAERQRDQDTTRLINAAVGQHDVARLRQIAAVRGLVSTELRARLWPLLLGAGPGSSTPANAPAANGAGGQLSRRGSTEGSLAGISSPRALACPANHAADGSSGIATTSSSSMQYEEWAAGAHKDTTTVRVDVERSLHTFAGFLGDQERAERRQELERLLNAVVVKHEGTVHYYQGLHDVASVLLLVAGEPAAFGMLCRLSTGHLRDATRASLDPVIELLGLMAPIVAAADAELAEFLARQGLPPFYALSWFLTWFSHDLVQFGEVCRLFDLFLATHPLMPLYVGAAAMVSQKQQLLAADEMPVLHSRLVNLSVTRAATADQLAIQAIKLYKRATPEWIIASRQLVLQQCITPRVELRGGAWHYPPPQTLGPGLWSQHRLQALMQQLLRLPLPGTPVQRKRLVLASLTGVISTLYVVGMCMFVARNPSASPLALFNRL